MTKNNEVESRIAGLLAENQRLSTILKAFELSSEGFFVVDSQDNLIHYNRAALSLWDLGEEEVWHGMSLDTLRSRLASALEHELDLPELPLEVLHKSQQPTKILPIVLLDGRMLEQYSYPLLEENHEDAWVWRFRDVTLQRRAEQALFQNQQYLERILSNAPMLFFATDAKGHLTLLRGRELALFGLEQNQLIGENVFLSERLPALDAVRQALEGESVRKIYEFSGIFFDVHYAPLRDEKGVVAGMIGIGLDVSEQQRINEMMLKTAQLQSAKQTAEIANIAKSSFIANMSHELRTPLNTVLGFTQLMLGDNSLSKEQRDNIMLIMNSGEHLLALINDILELSKIDLNKMELQAASFNLYETLENLLKIHHAKAVSKGLSFESQFADDLPLYLFGDRNKLRQILTNLLTNAIKYTEKGGIVFRAWLGDSLYPDASHLFFEVEDTGFGIAEEELELLFQLFTQTESGRKTQSGTGLGLYISQEFARLMRGSIEVESDLGSGSRFIADLYLENTEGPPEKADFYPQSVAQLAEGQGDYRILVVEDKWENRFLLQRVLEAAGFSVREAINGQEALAIWREWKPHLIWMDMKLPQMNGSNVTRQIRASAGGKDVVIIALTASAYEHVQRDALEAGCDDFLSKPFRTEELFQKIQQSLGLEFIYTEFVKNPVLRESFGRLEAKIEALPSDMHIALRKAVVQYSLSNVEAVCKEIEQLDAALAQEIAGLAKEFDFKTILNLLPH